MMVHGAFEPVYPTIITQLKATRPVIGRRVRADAPLLFRPAGPLFYSRAAGRPNCGAKRQTSILVVFVDRCVDGRK
jgi:hypothetical protein